MTIISASDPSAPASSSQAINASASLGQNDFLKLLVAQLKYQDPSKPTDGTAFITQTSQLSMVEKLEDILTAANANAVSSASVAATGLVGRTIEYTNKSGTKVTGPVSAVRLDRTGPVLVVGKDEVALGNVLQVLASATKASGTTVAATSAVTTATPAADTVTAASESTSANCPIPCIQYNTEILCSTTSKERQKAFNILNKLELFGIAMFDRC